MTKSLFCSSTRDVCEAVGLSATTLKELRRQGALVPSKHFRYVGAGRIRPRLVWNVQAVEAALLNHSRRLKP